MGASQLIWSREKIWLWFSLVAAPRDVMVIFVAYFLVPHYGALGLAASYALSKTFALVAALGINSKIGFGVA
jgi:O-antigen/teichoic acid export membrane protein